MPVRAWGNVGGNGERISSCDLTLAWLGRACSHRALAADGEVNCT
jgi:hypothetical protein